MKIHTRVCASVRKSIAQILKNPQTLPLVSDYWLLVAIDRHLSRCFDEVVKHRGFLGNVTLHTRTCLASEIAINISSLPDGSKMFVKVQFSLR